MTSYRIWDPFVRLFHWTLVLGFVGNALLIDDDSKAHEWVGYFVLALVGARLVWGLIGPYHARFASFFPSARAITGQLSDFRARQPRAHLGHTPLGALMIFNLLATMLAIGATGYMMTTNAFWGIDWVEEVHEALVNWAWVSIVLHVAAVIWESRRTGINLPRAMMTGRKDVPEGVTLVE
ncbi:cytochrome B [Roseovarius faecimaris]|uniref:Cytochrome B n=1 Tax=Roseovarius faecimaris TaxID=2494550 RepID=A0A6I6IS21_9RHOB|nr:cytochrome b/b6 domain-containing protein [Roseovarius faecimaris]QGX98693.1 cytochrome B [Roseovarius faecimaris]